ncbi:DUF1775 domain-containing protein [Gordonia amarae]|uniref:YncI copper-binding domain-containing protein n=2 Tax=Gordonia amarae TaxID=36821 RepID=G7GTY1_9ACTN|nr:DUF1775 domain-containing protein [Gordonia amarae]MCS3877716.1 uncharacterized protein YcnI [Gordonia amarae]QHN16420.1 DUF1775 domain-containing protein [Gordonia amarae]QHN20989.1 DUF1775 domain-containing protein [Gordonia amarae]QHN29841.1 DUF1775 domain-containing protein [Gordonia amarae]QHN38615.1 DUF1775 domain-containing protein [Gordonia amarae]
MSHNKSHNENPGPRHGLRAAIVALGALGLTAFGAGAASAHVSADQTVQPAQGGYGQVRLIVPTESDTARTTAVTVTIPGSVDLASARTLPIPGWTATVITAPDGQTERVSRIEWKADNPANGLGAQEFGVFTFSAGKWPTGVDSVSLPTEQRYSDGSVVRWNEEALDEASEPEHPAPTVLLGQPEGHGGAHGQGAHGQGAPGADRDTGAAAESDSSDPVARILGVVALIVALGAAAVGGALWQRGRPGERPAAGEAAAVPESEGGERDLVSVGSGESGPDRS